MRVKTGPVSVAWQDSVPDVIVRADASAEAVETMLDYPVDQRDGYTRSQWLWVRFPNGDVVLACYPQDQTYFDLEDEFP